MKKLPFLLLLPLLASALLSAAPSVTLNWQDNSDNEDGFFVERSEAGGAFLPIAQVGADVTTYSDERVRFGVVYTYRVNAYNADGMSGYTNEASHTAELPQVEELPPLNPPNDPTGLSKLDLARGLEAFAQSLRTGGIAANSNTRNTNRNYISNTNKTNCLLCVIPSESPREPRLANRSHPPTETGFLTAFYSAAPMGHNAGGVN